MHRHNLRHRSVMKVIGWAAVLVLYVAALVFAADLRTAGTTQPAGAPATAEVAAQAAVEAPAAMAGAVAEATAAAPASEAPLVTLAIAGTGLAAVGAWQLQRVLRRRRRRPAALVRRLVRGLTTLN
jgi:hypothetical protein